MYNDILDVVNRVKDIKAPEHWKEESGTQDPTDEVRLKTIKIIQEIYSKIEEYPLSISATIESGTYVTYQRDGIFLSFEVYNIDSSVCILVGDKKLKKIIYCDEVKNSEIDQALHVYEEESKKSI